jgi:hypothetical protein
MEPVQCEDNTVAARMRGAYLVRPEVHDSRLIQRRAEGVKFILPTSSSVSRSALERKSDEPRPPVVELPEYSLSVSV